MRETRHLWIGNLPENSREERVTDLFKRYGRVEKVKFLSRNSNGSQSALVAFVDIRSAQKAHLSVNMLGDKQLQTKYSDPSAAGRQDSSPTTNSRGNSSHRGHPASHRADNQPRPHDGERSHNTDRHRNEVTEEKARNFNKDKRESETVSPLKSEKKLTKSDNPKQVKKKAKKINADEQKSKKGSKKDRGRSPTVKRKSTGSKKSVKGSSSEEEGTSSSSNSTSRTSSSNSHSSSSTNSTASTGTRSTGESDAEIVGVGGSEQLVTMIIKKLPVRPSVNSLRDGIYHEFKKCGKVKSVLIRGDNNSRHALVLFRTSGEANKAVGHAKTKLLFGAAIEAAIYEGEVSGKELQECGGIIDEFHPRSSRTLFVGNLDKTVGYSDIQNIFVRFGEIVAIEIKKQNNIPQYAFLQYTDVASVVKAIQKMDGERLGKNTLKLGFGKTVMSSCIWVEGVTDSFTEHYLASCFQKYGNVERVVIDRNRGQALVFYLKYEQAQQALNNMRGRKMNGSRLKLDFASQELIELFLTHMQSSGQSVTTIDSIRHLLLPAPSSSGAPPSLPQAGTTRSSRSSSSHPYPSEPYYDEAHRFPPAPPNFDLRGPSPSRGEWRGWDERSRTRPVYQGVSPRGRRFEDERHERDYYHREDEYYPDRAPPSGYDLEHRSREFSREHSRDYGPPSRTYTEDYHRGVKPGRERRERESLYHPRSVHSPMSRGRRSRSFSPRGGAPGSRGGREYLKSESRGREYPDHPMSRGRTPPKSPGSREGRGSGSEAWGSRKIRGDKYSSPASHPSPVCHASPGAPYKADERRVEMREAKSPKAKSRSKQEGWHPGKGREAEEWSPPMDYDRSRSETPTRDENLGSIGEVIIKQPVSSKITRAIKQEEERKPVSRTGSRTSSCHSERDLELREAKSSKKEMRAHKRAHLLQRVHSSSASEMSSDGQKHSKHSKASKKLAESKSKVQVLKSRPQTSDSDSDHRFRAQNTQQEVDSKPTQRRKSTDSNRSLGLIKREFSPTSSSEHKKSRAEKSGDAPHRKPHEKTRKNSKHPEEEMERSASSHKKRRHSERTKEQALDSDQSSSPSRKERKMSESSKLHHHGNNDDDEKTTRRSRKTSLKHEAPMSIASQCFRDEAEDDAPDQQEEEDREPSSQFPQRHLREEILEDMEQKEATADIVVDNDGKAEEERSASRRSSSDQTSHISKVSQPFVSSYNPYLMKPTTVRRQLSHDTKISKEKSEVAPGVKKESASNLSKLEQEKQRLEGLLCKLDSEQNLEVEEANAVADVYLENIENKLKTKSRQERKISAPSDAVKVAPAEVATDLMDVPEFEIEEEEQTFEEVEDDVVEEVLMLHKESPPAKEEEPKDVDARQDCREQMEEQRREVEREKEVHCLIRKQKREDKKHTKRIEKLRGPSQGIVSSIDEEGLEEEEVDAGKNNVKDATKDAESDKLPNSNGSDCGGKTSPTPKESSDLNCDHKQTAVAEIRSSTKPEENKFVSPSSKPEAKTLKQSRSESTESAPQRPTKSPSVTQKIDDLVKMMQSKTPVSTSPYTPKSASSVGKSSQASQKSGSSRNNSPSPSNGRKPHQQRREPQQPHPQQQQQQHQHMQARKSSSSSSGRHNSHHNKTPSSEKKRRQDHHRHHHKRVEVRKAVKAKPLTALTVALSSSEPLGRKELEILKAELEMMRHQLDLETSSYLLSPASDEDHQIAPVSPILKSPNADPMLTPDASSIDSTRSRISPSLTPLTERLKLLGRVKKKPKEGGSNEESVRRVEKLHTQGSQEFKSARPLRSSIFDQDLARLSHLQNNEGSTPGDPVTPLLSNFIDPNDLAPNNKPLFSAYAETSGLLEPQCANYLTNNNSATTGAKPAGVKTAPKNVSPLSSDLSVPATAERSIVSEAGKVDGARPKDERSTVESTDQVGATPVRPGAGVVPGGEKMSPEITDDGAAILNVEIAEEKVEEKSFSDLGARITNGDVDAGISNPDVLIPPKEEEDAMVASESNIAVEAMDIESPGSFLDVDLGVSETTVKEEVVDEKKSIFGSKPEVGSEYVIPVPEAISTEEIVNLEDSLKKEEEVVLEEGGSFEEVKHPDLFAEELIETVEVGAHEQEILVEEEDHSAASAEKSLEDLKNKTDIPEDDLLEKRERKVEQSPPSEYIVPVSVTNEVDIRTSQRIEDLQTDVAQDFFESSSTEILNKSQDLIIEEDVELPEDGDLVIEHPEEVETQPVPAPVEEETKTPPPPAIQSKLVPENADKVAVKKEHIVVEKPDIKTEKLAEKVVEIVEERTVIETISTVKEKHSKSERDENKSDSKSKKLYKKSSQKEGRHSDKHSTSKSSNKLVRPITETSKSSSKVSIHRKHDKIEKSKSSISKTSSTKDGFKSKSTDSKDSKDDARTSKEDKSEVKKENVHQSSKISHDSKPIKQESKPFKSTQDPKFLSKLSEVKPEKKTHSEKSSQPNKSVKSSHESKSSSEKHHSHSERKSKDPSAVKSEKSGSEKPPQDLKLLKKASSLSQKFEKRVQESKPKSRDSSFEKSKSFDDGSKSRHPEKKKTKEIEKKKLVSKKHKMDDDSREKHAKSEHKSSEVKSKKKEKSLKHSDAKKESSHHRDSAKSTSKSAKHHKSSHESDQPMKKKPRLDEKSSKKVVKKSESRSHFLSTDSEESDERDYNAPKKPTKNADGEKAAHKKERQKFPERRMVSEDSGSSDEFDNFISQMNKSKKQVIYSSDETSSESDLSPARKPKIEPKAKKSFHIDSDHSDKSAAKKKSSKISNSSSEVRKEKSSKDLELKSKSKSFKTDKKPILKPKESTSSKHSKMPSHASDSEKKAKSETKPPKYLSSDDSSLEDFEDKPREVAASETPSAKPSKQKDAIPEPVDRKSSSSSLESLDYPPPSPTSTNLTTQTIKAETLVSTGYLDFTAFRSSDKDKPKESKESSAKTFPKSVSVIYTSSSSDSDSSFEAVPSKSKFPVNVDDKIKEFTSSSESDSDDFDKLLQTAMLQKRESKVADDKRLKEEARKSAEPKVKQHAEKAIKKDLSSTRHPKQHDVKSGVSKTTSSSHHKGEKKTKSSPDVKTSKHPVSSKDSNKQASESAFKHLPLKDSSLKKSSSFSKENSSKHSSTMKPESSKHMQGKDSKHHVSKDPSKHKKEGSSKHISKDASANVDNKKHKAIQRPHDDKSTHKPHHSEEMKSDETKKHSDRHKSSDKSRKLKKLHKHSHDSKDPGKPKDSKHSSVVQEKTKHSIEGQHKQPSLKSKHRDSERKVSKDSLSVKPSADSHKSKSPLSSETKHKKLHHKPKPSSVEKAKSSENEHVKSHQHSTPGGVKTEMKKQTGFRTKPASKPKPLEVQKTPKLSPVVKKQEAVDSDSNPPGKSFFDSDSSESDDSIPGSGDSKQFGKSEDLERENSQEPFKKLLASPTRPKSLFSPPRSKEEEPERLADPKDVFPPKQIKSDPEASSKHQPSDLGNKKKKSIQKIHESSKPDLVSSFERIQAEKRSRQEERERQKKLSQQRDEEAVRSIMSGDETSDSMYHTDTSCKSDLADTKLDLSGAAITEPVAFVVKQESAAQKPFAPQERKPSQSDTSASSGSDATRSAAETLSTAQEMELAAAVSSIYGDFGEKEEEVGAPFQLFTSFDASPKVEETPSEVAVKEEDKGSDEAALAASALIMERDVFSSDPKPFPPQFEKAEKNPWMRNRPSSLEKKKRDPSPGLTSPPKSAERKTDPGLTSPGNDRSPKLKPRENVEKPVLKGFGASDKKDVPSSPWSISKLQYPQPTPAKPSHPTSNKPQKPTPVRSSAWNEDEDGDSLILPTIKSDEQAPFLPKPLPADPHPTPDVKDVPPRPFVPVASPARKEFPKPEAISDVKSKDAVPAATNPPSSGTPRRRSRELAAIDPPGGARVHASPRSYGHHLPASISLPAGSRTNPAHSDPPLLSSIPPPPHHTSPSLHPPPPNQQSPQRLVFFQPPFVQDINPPHAKPCPSVAKQPADASPVSGAFKLPQTQPFVIPSPDLSPGHNFSHFPKLQTPTSSPMSQRNPFFPTSLQQAATNPSPHQMIYSQKGVEPYQVPPHHMAQNQAHRPHTVPQRSPTMQQRSPTVSSVPPRTVQPSATHLPLAGQHVQQNMPQMAPNTQHMASSTPHMTPRTPHIAPSTHHMAPSTPHMAPNMPHMAPMTPHMAASTPHMAQNTPHMAPSTPHIAPSAPQMAPSTPQMAPSTPHMAPMTPHMAPNTPHMANTQHMASSTPQMAPSTPRMAQMTPQMAPSTPHMAQMTPHMAPSTPQRPPSAGHAQMAPIRIPNYPPSPATTSPTRAPLISPKLTSPTAVSMRMTQPTPSPTARMQVPISIPLYSPPQSTLHQTPHQPQHSKPGVASSTTTHQQPQQPSHFQPGSNFQIQMFQQNTRGFPASTLPAEPKKTTASPSTTATEPQKITHSGHSMSPYNQQAMFYPGILPYAGMHFANPFPRYLPRPLIPMPQQRAPPGASHTMAGQPRGHVLPGQQNVAGHALPGGAPLTHLLHRQPQPTHMGEVIPMTQSQPGVPKSPQKQPFFHPHVKNDPGMPKPAQTPPRAAPSPTHPSHQLPRQPPPRHVHPAQGHRSVVSMTSEAPLDMVDQHFRKSGIAPVSISPAQHSAVPPSGQHQTSMGQPRPGYQGFPGHSYRPEMSHLGHQSMPHLPHLPHPFQRTPEQNYPQNTTPGRNPTHHIPPSNSPHHYPQSAPPVPGRLTPRHSTPPLSHPHRGSQPLAPQNPPELQQEATQEPASLEELFKRYPVIWQGKLALKTESAAVQLHYVSGDIQLGQTGLPKHADSSDPGGLAVLRIIRRMRINHQQLEGISKRMMMDNDFCMLLALPCGRDKEDVARHTSALSTGFIEYLQQKQVAGIVNTEGVLDSTQQRTSFVVHIFPPCDFSTTNLQQRAPDLLTNVGDIHHLLIVITAA